MKNIKTNAVSFAQAKLKAKIAIAILAALLIFTLASCVINVPDDKSPLDGDWIGLSDEVVRIKGNTGRFFDLSNTTGSWGSAVYYEVIKVGDVKFRDLTKTGDRTWTCDQCSVAPYYSIPASLEWSFTTITLSADGQSFVEEVRGHINSYTWTRQ
jgi:hypothetical protein